MTRIIWKGLSGDWLGWGLRYNGGEMFRYWNIGPVHIRKYIMKKENVR